MPPTLGNPPQGKQPYTQLSVQLSKALLTHLLDGLYADTAREKRRQSIVQMSSRSQSSSKAPVNAFMQSQQRSSQITVQIWLLMGFLKARHKSIINENNNNNNIELSEDY